jgi:hypothetical protein
MKDDNKWNMLEASKDLGRVFVAAEKNGPQLVFDKRGVFTVSFSELGKDGSAIRYLTKGGPDNT